MPNVIGAPVGQPMVVEWQSRAGRLGTIVWGWRAALTAARSLRVFGPTARPVTLRGASVADFNRASQGRL